MGHRTRPWQAVISRRIIEVLHDRSMLRQLAALLLLSPVNVMPVQAHQIESALSYLDGTLELTSQFSNGEPTHGAVVRLLNPDGSTGQELGRTDASGRLQLDLRDVADGVLDLQVDGGPGHRDYLELPVKQGEVDLDAVVFLPVSLMLMGLIVSVRRRNDDNSHGRQHGQ